jgi:hypothetical protein
MFQQCYSPTAFLKTDNLSEKVLCLGSKSTGVRGSNVQVVDVVVQKLDAFDLSCAIQSTIPKI